MQKVKWFDRSFNFSTQQNIFPSIIERLSGTPARLEEKLRSIPSALLEIKPDNTWSIKENIGHLTDLEPLWQGRLQDIINGEKELRPTDLANAKTGTGYQFMRKGYFTPDKHSTPEHLIFNRTVTLKDGWVKK